MPFQSAYDIHPQPQIYQIYIKYITVRFSPKPQNCEVKTEIEIIDSSSVRTEQEVGENSRNKKIENSLQLLHNPVEIIRSTLNVDEIVDEYEISKIEETFEINQNYYWTPSIYRTN